MPSLVVVYFNLEEEEQGLKVPSLVAVYFRSVCRRRHSGLQHFWAMDSQGKDALGVSDDDADNDDGRLAECSISMDKSCSWRSNVVEERRQKRRKV